jgi:FAD/FMN-containing dehydrogenase
MKFACLGTGTKNLQRDVAGTPSAIALVTSDKEVVHVLKFAVKHQLKVCVSAGKHSHYSSISDSLVIDLRKMSKITINETNKTAIVQAGAKLGDFDMACAPYNLATTAGTNPDTGVAGLTLGGGAGFLCRKHGLTLDNLLSVKIVLLTGEIVTASKTENQDLFWGVSNLPRNKRRRR